MLLFQAVKPEDVKNIKSKTSNIYRLYFNGFSGNATAMILIESKCFGFLTSDRFSLGVRLSSRFLAVTFILLVQIVGRLVSSDSIDFLVQDITDDKIKIGNFHKTERFMRDVSENAATSSNSNSNSNNNINNNNNNNNNNMKLPYQNFRDASGRFPVYPEVDSFIGKSKSMPLTTRIVRTKYGDVSGVIVSLDSRHLEPVEVFRGIPYAMPPTGSLRFMPPVSGALWSGVKHADKFSPVCPQRLPDISNETLALKRMSKGRLDYLKRLLPYLQNQSEDCLYLNIYAPAQGESFFFL